MKRLSAPARAADSIRGSGSGQGRGLTEKEHRTMSEFKEAAGSTPLMKLDIPVPNGNRIYAKCEFRNPTGSHYDRVYPNLLEILIRNGYGPENYGLVETSSGNATPAFVRLCKALGYRAWAVLPRPDELSETRLNLTKQEGATLVHPDPRIDGYGLVGVAARMLRLIRESRNWQTPLWSPNHSAVAETVDAMLPLAQEIVDAMSGRQGSVGSIGCPAGRLDYFVGIPGNGTTLYGVGAPLRQAFPDMRIIAIEPHSSPGLFLLKYPEMREAYVRSGSLPRLEPTPGKVHEYKIRMPGSGCYGVAESFPHILASVPLLDSIRQIDDANQEWEKPVQGGKSGNDLLQDAHGFRVGTTSEASLMVALELARLVRDSSILVIFYDLREGRY